VRAYFKDRPTDLLELCVDCISNVEKEKRLSAFLGCPKDLSNRFAVVNVRSKQQPFMEEEEMKWLEWQGKYTFSDDMSKVQNVCILYTFLYLILFTIIDASIFPNHL
jgi:hypothetical protein